MENLTTKDVARLLSVSEQSVRRYIDNGDLPAVRMMSGGWRMVSPKALEKFAKERGIELNWNLLEAR
jgi:excisionase family DNA binding protein